MRAVGVRFLALVWLGCGARSELDPGASPAGEGGSSEGGSGGGIVPLDPETECPLVCDLESCLPAVLVEDVPVGWHAIVDGILYYTTAKPEGDNGLFRAGVCGGEPQLLLASEQFLGYGAVIGDEVFVTTGDPIETVRLAKAGGAPTLYHSDAGDVVSTRGIFDPGYGQPILVRYHFDHSFGLYEFDEDGDLLALITNLPDPDYEAVASDGFGFIPNLPAEGYTGSAFGVYGSVSSSMSVIPVIGPLVTDGELLYFTGEPEVGGLQQYQLKPGEDSETLPILGSTSGYILAVAGGTLFGALDDSAEHAGTVWRAQPDAAEPNPIFRSGQFVQDLVTSGNSLYVRTERRIVRVPKLCPAGSAAPCLQLD